MPRTANRWPWCSTCRAWILAADHQHPTTPRRIDAVQKRELERQAAHVAHLATLPETRIFEGLDGRQSKL